MLICIHVVLSPVPYTTADKSVHSSAHFSVASCQCTIPAAGIHQGKWRLPMQGHYPIYGTATQYGKDAGAYPGNYNGWANVSAPYHTLVFMPHLFSEALGAFLKCKRLS